MNRFHTTLALAAAATLPASLSAQTATSLVESGDTVGGQTVGEIFGFNVNSLGDFAAVTGDGTSSSANEFVIASGLTGVTLVDVEGADINDFSGAPDISDTGSVVYRIGGPGSNDTAIFRDGARVFTQGDDVPADPNLGDYRIPSRPQLTADGTNLAFQSSTVPPPSTGSNSGNAIFVDGGNDTAVQFVFGVPASTDTITTGSGTTGSVDLIDSDFEISDGGLFTITKVGVAGLSPAADDFIAIADISTGNITTATDSTGSVIVEGGAIPGIADATWDNFNRFGINDDGSYLFTGDYDDDSGPSTNTVDFLALDGVIVLQEGDVVDGTTIQAGFDAAELSTTGSYATLVDSNDIDSDVDTLIVDGQVVFSLGDAVAIDAGLDTLASFEDGVDALGITPSVAGVFDVFFAGTTDNGTSGIFSITVPEPASAVLLAGAGALLLGRRRRA